MLSPKQARFVAEYLKDLNAAQAAVRAGYSSGKRNTSARSQGHRLLGYPAIAAAVAASQAKLAVKSDVTAQRVIDELAMIAFFDPRGLFDDAGNARPTHELPPELARTLSVETSKAMGVTVNYGTRIKPWDKPRALELLARHLGILKDKVEHSGEVAVAVRMVDEFHTS